jgi:pyruvate,water dikinase
MNEAAIRSLDGVRLADAWEVGGKAASLGELLATGIRVPAGVVLTAGAAALTPDERQSLLMGIEDELGGGSFAVRSSAVAEDGVERSFAGMFETVLDVPSAWLATAVERVLASADADPVTAYRHDADAGTAAGYRMAVIVERMIRPAAAGVALTADPISGDRRSCVISAVKGTGDRLVSGSALGDEWVVDGERARPGRQPEAAIDRDQAMVVAREARRIASARGVPQDIEWAIDTDGALWILQARPMTGLPPAVSWEPRARGAYTRNLRLGEWISEPVTPLFESWLLDALEEGLHATLRRWIGQWAPRPYHVVVNGWYFYSIAWLSGGALLRSLPSIVWHLIRSPRRVAGVIPPTVRHSVPVFERDWREDLQPRYRAAVAEAEARVETTPVAELPALIDGLAAIAGEYVASIAALGGAAYKMEMNLARFYRRHLGPSLGGSHLPLLAGFEPPADPESHAVVSLDWWLPPLLDQAPATVSSTDHARVVHARHAAEQAAFGVLASSPRRLRGFRRLLAETQHLVPVREEQSRELTLAWPVMRRAVLRIGEALAATGRIERPDDVFFLTRAEAHAAVGGETPPGDFHVAARRSEREAQRRLVPPMLIGPVNRVLRSLWESFPRQLGAERSDLAIVSGSPASAGRATGPVRVVRGPEDFDALQPGEVLVAPLTAPAWTPLFTRASAVVTDVGSAASHASIIAREYGIPAVVGCGDATARLRTGMRVVVDGSTGNVEPA